MASKRRTERRAAARLAKSPAGLPGTQTDLTPRAQAMGGATFNPAGGGPGNTASRAPTGPQNVAGDIGAAVVPAAELTNRYNQAAGPVPPTAISDVDLANNIWSPFQPVVPFGPPSINYPRTFDYQTGQNLDFTARGRLTFMRMLQTLSRSWGILRAVIETRKDQLMRIPWDVQLIEKPDQEDPRLDEIRAFLKRPDRENNFNTWLRMQLEDRFVIDASNYYVWKDRGNKPYAIMQIAGETINPLIDDAGRRPVYPNPAYQQIIKGLPWQNLDSSEFLYAPQRRTRQDMFGYSEVQQIYIEILQGIKKMLYKLSYWDDGNIPQLMITVPSGWTPEQLAAFQGHMDIMLAGNIPFKSRIRFMPSDSKPFDLKNANGDLLKTEEDEWVTRLVCFAFSVSPQPFVRQMNRATAESAAQAAEEEGLHPLMSWVKDELLDPVIQSPMLGFGYEDVEFVWQPEPEVDTQKQMTVLTGYTKVGLMTLDEGRDQLNLPPLPDGTGAEAVVITPTGPIPFKETLEANRQKALAAPDELGRTQEMHDAKMDQMQNPPAPKGPPGNGKGPPKKGAPVGKGLRACGHDHGPVSSDDIGLLAKARLRRAGRRLESVEVNPRFIKSAARAAHKVLMTAAEQVADQIRAAARVKKLAKAYPRPGDPDFDPNPPVAEPPDPVDPESIAEMTFDLSAIDGLEDAIGDELASAAEDAASDILGQVGLTEDDELVDQVSEAAVDAAREQAAELVSGIDDTTRDMLRDEIAGALEENVGLDELVSRIMDSTAFGEDRADLIARTEVRNANEAGVLEGLKGARDAGNVVKKEWLLGPNPCPICEANADAGPIDLDDVFPSGDDAPSAHPNCVCSVTGVIEETGDEADISGDVIEELARIAKGYNPDQPRDDRGRFGSGSGESPSLFRFKNPGGPTLALSEPGSTLQAREIAAIAKNVATDLKFDATRITISDQRRQFELNGKLYDYAGSATISGMGKGDIKLYTPFLSRDTAAGVVAHEIGHQKFQSFIDRADAEAQTMRGDPDYHKEDKWGVNDRGFSERTSLGFMRPDGTLNPPYDKKYPAYQVWEKARIGGLLNQLAKDDGVSNYSRDWWNAAEKGTATFTQAVHETIAEMARFRQAGEAFRFMPRKKLLDGTPILTLKQRSNAWFSLYSAMDKNWKGKL